MLYGIKEFDCFVSGSSILAGLLDTPLPVLEMQDLLTFALVRH